ncbi:MAG: ribose-phosphate pyrophosphokinase [Lachnospiraceae bacterium]|nr:ribose-phosphate pyrophosphokinase [Lachnospiraceae bacterium]
MIKYNEKIVDINKFPDGTLLLKEAMVSGIGDKDNSATITWKFENNEELIVLFYLVRHLQSLNVKDIYLKMPYIPNARQDRVKNSEDVFTLKYFAEIINSLGFSKVTVLDPHSSVSEALIDRIEVQSPKSYIEKVIEKIGDENLIMFYPDEGAMKRYSGMIEKPYAFGIKKREWKTGVIKGLDVSGEAEAVKESNVLIVDDICSKGGTFLHSARKLKELGAKDIYLYVSHCENTILAGELLESGLITKVFTTDSIFTENDERIEVFDYV